MLKWLQSFRWSIRKRFPYWMFRLAKWWDGKFGNKESRMIFAAYARCSCGAGLAYDPCGESGQPFGFWDCSDILLGRAIPSGKPGAVQHHAPWPFAFYSVIAECSPRAGGATTRSKKETKASP